MSKTYRRVLATLLLGAVIVFVVSRAQAADEQKVADRIASFVQGRLIVSGATVYRAASVSAAVDTGGHLYLRVDGDPLYRLESRDRGSRPDGHYDYALPAKAKCGDLEADRSIEGTHFAVREGSLFVDLRDALRVVMDEVPTFHSAPALIQIGAGDLQKIRACARTVMSQLEATPFQSIEIYSGKQLLSSVGRTVRSSTVYEYDPGENTPVSHIVVTPRQGKVADYTVEVRAVSVMHCDYEGPHIELDKWKRGLSAVRTLRRKDGVFMTDKQMSDTKAPKFPAYTQAELRRAIKAHFGEQGLAPLEEAKPCAPFLHGHRITVKYRSKVVHEIAMTYPGGC